MDVAVPSRPAFRRVNGSGARALPPARDGRTLPRVTQEWLRKASGLARAGGWLWLLWTFHAPWRELGGLVGERTRWAERVVLGLGLILGMAAGSQARVWSAPSTGLDHAWFLRWIHAPAGTAVAVALVALEARGEWRTVLILVNGWLALCAGFDFEIAARPLVEGRDYRFRGPVEDAEDEDEPEED